MSYAKIPYFISRLLLAIPVFILTFPSVANAWHENFPSYEAYINYLGHVNDYPDFVEADWTDNAQGITNDGIYWYITQKTKLIIAPETADLSGNLYQYGYTRMEDWPALAGYSHFGDISFYDPYPDDGRPGYILVPVDTGPSDALLAIFQADATLRLIGQTVFPGQGKNAGWVAVGPDGSVYSSINTTTEIRRYAVNWQAIAAASGPVTVTLTHTGNLPLVDRDGITLVKLYNMQGGVITRSGSVIFLTNGYFTYGSIDPNVIIELANSWGAHAFEIKESGTCVRIARSCQDNSCLFHYEFHPDSFEYQEPEGLTIWDQDFGNAPHIDGQLHIMMMDTFTGDPTDNIYLKHYTNRIPVSPADDLQTSYDNSWSGSELSLETGTYHQQLPFDKRVRIESRNGPSVIYDQ